MTALRTCEFIGLVHRTPKPKERQNSHDEGHINSEDKCLAGQPLEVECLEHAGQHFP